MVASKPQEIISTERPEIEYSNTTQDGLKHDHIYLKVRGKSLEDCKKYFDEIMKDVV